MKRLLHLHFWNFKSTLANLILKNHKTSVIPIPFMVLVVLWFWLLGYSVCLWEVLICFVWCFVLFYIRVASCFLSKNNLGNILHQKTYNLMYKVSWHQYLNNVDPNGYLVLLDRVIELYRERKEYCQNILSVTLAMWKTWHFPLSFFILEVP